MNYTTAITAKKARKSTRANKDNNPAHHKPKHVDKLLSLLGIDTGGKKNLLISPGILTLFDADKNLAEKHPDLRLYGLGVKFNYPVLLQERPFAGRKPIIVKGEFFPEERDDCIDYKGNVTTTGLTGNTETALEGEFCYSHKDKNFIPEKQLRHLYENGAIRRKGVYRNENGKKVFVLEETINVSLWNLMYFYESLGIGDITEFYAGGGNLAKAVASFIPPQLISMLRQYKGMEGQEFNEKDSVYLYRRQSLFFNNEKEALKKTELDKPYQIVGAIHSMKTQQKSNIYALDTLILTQDKTPVCAGVSSAVEYALDN